MIAPTPPVRSPCTRCSGRRIACANARRRIEVCSTFTVRVAWYLPAMPTTTLTMLIETTIAATAPSSPCGVSARPPRTRCHGPERGAPPRTLSITTLVAAGETSPSTAETVTVASENATRVR